MKNLETKKDIRRQARSDRAGLPEGKRIAYSASIQHKLLEHPFYQQADEIYCYVSFGDEVITAQILEESFRQGKKVAVPKILTEEMKDCRKYMEFFYIHSMEELEEGYYGILEPVTRERAVGRNVLVVMPGVAFDSSCHRIGYGGGFYDAYLRRHPDYRTIALAYSIQCLEQIPCMEHDICPEIILTEKESYTC